MSTLLAETQVAATSSISPLWRTGGSTHIKPMLCRELRFARHRRFLREGPRSSSAKHLDLVLKVKIHQVSVSESVSTKLKRIIYGGGL